VSCGRGDAATPIEKTRIRFKVAASSLSMGMRFAAFASVVLVGLSPVSLVFAQETMAPGRPGDADTSGGSQETRERVSEGPEEAGPKEPVAPSGIEAPAQTEALTPEGDTQHIEQKSEEPAAVESGAQSTKGRGESSAARETDQRGVAEQDAEAPRAASLEVGPDDAQTGPADRPAPTRTGLVFAPRLGLTIGGAAHLGLECEETGDLSCGTFGIRDHKEASGFGLAADALYGWIPELRLGAMLMWLPQAKGDAGGEMRRLGTEVQLQAVAEGVFDLMARLAVTVRVQGGGSVLSPKGFIDDVVKEAQEDCETARDAGVDCTVHDGPYFAPTWGGGAGILVQTKSAARLRLDFLFQSQTFPIYEQKAASGAGTVQANVTLDQSRFWLLGGFEI
jgi:hypothetical protein